MEPDHVQSEQMTDRFFELYRLILSAGCDLDDLIFHGEEWCTSER